MGQKILSNPINFENSADATTTATNLGLVIGTTVLSPTGDGSRLTNLNVNFSGINTVVASNSANWNNSFTGFASQSANNTNVYTTVNINSSDWNNTKTTVNSNSASWIGGNSAFTTVNGNSANWNNSFTGFASQSANNTNAFTTIQNTSSDWNTTKTTVNLNSATTWNYQGTDLKNLSAAWVGGNSAFTTVNGNSANWNNAFTGFASQSANDINVQTTVNSNSASWVGGNSAFTTVNGNSANWNNTYTTVSTISSVWSTFNLNFIIDGAGDTITTGSKGYITVPYHATIQAWTLLADQSGSITVDVRKCNSNTFPTTTSIASPSASMTSVQISSSNSLVGWTTAINAGDILEFVINNVTSIQRVTISLSGTKP